MKIKLRFFSSLVLLLALLVSTFSAFAQNGEITVRGVVKDETGLPIIGATVMVPNTQKGAITGYDGDFTLKVKKGTKLRFSYIGYQTLDLVASPKMKVQLKPDQQTLDDVVVVGYMPRKVANTSASVVKVKGSTLASQPVANPLDAIQGKVSGLQISSVSGEPSADLEIKLHGQGSFRGVSAPFVLVDGVPSSLRNIRAMNPNDIESMQFLKDAAATSIYGARAANGVIYVTTKRGSSDGDANISVRTQYGVSTLANTDYFDQLMSADELLRYYEQTGIYKKKDLARLQEKLFQGRDFSWYKYVYQPASMYTADLSISGGTRKLNYYISGGASSQDGLKAGSSYKKVFGRINLNSKLNKYIDLTLNTSVSYDKSNKSPFKGSDRSGGGLAVLNSPYFSPYDPETGKEMNYNPAFGLVSPKHMLETHPSADESALITTNATITIRPIENLMIRSLVGADLSFRDITARTLPSFEAGNGVGSAMRGSGKGISLTTTNTATYNLHIGRNGFTFLIGQEYLDTEGSGINALGSGLTDDRLHLLSHLTTDKQVSEEESSFANLSFFSQFSYDFKERYFVDLVLRNDRTSAFSAKNRSGIFWSVGLLWKAKKEKFLRDVKWLNSLDVKGSYGTQGQPVTSNMNNFYVGRTGQKNGAMGLGSRAFGNPDLTWENQTKLTLGVKARLWNKFEFNLELYNRLTKDMHFDRQIPMSKGLDKIMSNGGSYQNRGVDLQLMWDVLKHKDYSLSTYVNFNYNQDELLSLYGDDTQFYNGYEGYVIGQPVTYYLPIYKGVNKDTGKPEWYKPGKDITKTREDDKALSTEYSASLEQNTGIAIGTPFSGGWGLNAHWRNFYLRADFSYEFGKHTLSLDKSEFENDNRIRNKDGNWNGSRNLFDYWKEPGDVKEFPSLEYVRSNNHESTYMDTKMLENSSYMRMKNLTIGYRVSEKQLKKVKFLKRAKVYFSGRNLLTFTKYRGSDPEIPAGLGANPNTKQFSVGLELNF